MNKLTTGSTSLYCHGEAPLRYLECFGGELQVWRLKEYVEVGGGHGGFPSMALVILFPELLCKGNSPDLLGPPLGSAHHEG